MAASYQPTAAEVEAFNRDLRKYVAFVEEEDDGEFTASDLRELAQHHWPGRNVRVKSDVLGIDWIDSDPPVAAPPEPVPAAVAEVAEAKPEPKPQIPAGRYIPPPPPSVVQARKEWAETYGAPEGARFVYYEDGGSTTFDGGGKITGGYVSPAVQASIEALTSDGPAYGGDGYGQSGVGRSHHRSRAGQAAIEAQAATSEAKQQEARDRKATVKAAVQGSEGPINWEQLKRRMSGRPA